MIHLFLQAAWDLFTLYFQLGKFSPLMETGILGHRKENNLIFSISMFRLDILACRRRERSTRWEKSSLILCNPWEPSSTQLLFHRLLLSPCTHSSSSATDRWWWRPHCCVLESAQCCVINTKGRIPSEGLVILYTPTHSFALRYPNTRTHRSVRRGIDQLSWHLWTHVYTPTSSHRYITVEQAVFTLTFLLLQVSDCKRQ